MSKKRKRSQCVTKQQFSDTDEPFTKRRKSCSRTKQDIDSDRYSYTNDTCEQEEYACFHFDCFKSFASPYPCLYKSCNCVVFDSWSEWKQHWLQNHHHHYSECGACIPLNQLNDKHPKIKQSTFRHLQFITMLGTENASDWESHCILSFDLSKPKQNREYRFNISQLRTQQQLIWDPMSFEQHRLRNNQCNPMRWDRIRSAAHCARDVKYFESNSILFRCGGYFAANISEHNTTDDYNEMSNNSFSSYCDAFDIDRKQQFILPNLPQPVHSSSLIYVKELECLLNIGGDDDQTRAMNHVYALVMDENVTHDSELRWSDKIFPRMSIKRSYCPSVGLCRDSQSVTLFVAGGCNTQYDGLRKVESLQLTQWIHDKRNKEEKENNNRNKKNKKERKRQWVKHKMMHSPRRDASNLVHWASLNKMVCCGGDHGEGEIDGYAVTPWYTSETYDLTKTKWIKLPNFPQETSHAQNPFIWIEGGIKDNNYWSGIRQTPLFDGYASFDASHGVLCVIGNGFCTNELGIISFYDPRTKQWQSGGQNQDNWLHLESNYLGLLQEKQQLRTICAVSQ